MLHFAPDSFMLYREQNYSEDCKKIIQRFSLDRSIQVFLTGGLKVLLVFVSIIIITEYLGIPTTSLVALLSIVSLAISFVCPRAFYPMLPGD